jgi:hypothetical protein
MVVVVVVVVVVMCRDSHHDSENVQSQVDAVIGY